MRMTSRFTPYVSIKTTGFRQSSLAKREFMTILPRGEIAVFVLLRIRIRKLLAIIDTR